MAGGVRTFPNKGPGDFCTIHHLCEKERTMVFREPVRDRAYNYHMTGNFRTRGGAGGKAQEKLVARMCSAHEADATHFKLMVDKNCLDMSNCTLQRYYVFGDRRRSPHGRASVTP